MHTLIPKGKVCVSFFFDSAPSAQFPTQVKGIQIMKATALSKLIGISILAFGSGILISFFLPESVLAVIEAILIVAIGILFFFKPKC